MTVQRKVREIVGILRKKHKKGLLSPSQVNELKVIGFTFEIENTASANKRMILEIAESGGPRPKQRSKLGSALCSYLKKGSGGCYDADFEAQLRKIRPDWFVTQTDIANQKKAEILKLAREGKPRPSQRTRLGQALSSYLTKKRRGYDAEFEKELRAIRPDWFRKG